MDELILALQIVQIAVLAVAVYFGAKFRREYRDTESGHQTVLGIIRDVCNRMIEGQRSFIPVYDKVADTWLGLKALQEQMWGSAKLGESVVSSHKRQEEMQVRHIETLDRIEEKLNA